MKKAKKEKKMLDMIIMLILIVLVLAMALFTLTRETSNQKIILMEIYKSAAPSESTILKTHYYVYENTNMIEIRNANSNGSNSISSKDISQDLIDNFKNSLEEYINKNITINSSFYTNERYTIEYHGASIIVPNPSVVSALGFDSNDYAFYNTIEAFINSINN